MWKTLRYYSVPTPYAVDKPAQNRWINRPPRHPAASGRRAAPAPSAPGKTRSDLNKTRWDLVYTKVPPCNFPAPLGPAARTHWSRLLAPHSRPPHNGGRMRPLPGARAPAAAPYSRYGAASASAGGPAAQTRPPLRPISARHKKARPAPADRRGRATLWKKFRDCPIYTAVEINTRGWADTSLTG